MKARATNLTGRESCKVGTSGTNVKRGEGRKGWGRGGRGRKGRNRERVRIRERGRERRGERCEGGEVIRRDIKRGKREGKGADFLSLLSSLFFLLLASPPSVLHAEPHLQHLSEAPYGKIK